MTDIMKDGLVLKRESKVGVSYLKLTAGDSGNITLIDLEPGTEFHLNWEYFEALLEGGTFKVANPDELEAFLARQELPESPQDIRDREEQQRRMKYVSGAFDAGIPLGTPRKLASYISIKSLELVDTKPPSAQTLYRWIRAYQQSGCDQSSLTPRYKQAGNRLPKVTEEHDSLISDFLRTIDCSLKASIIYSQYLEALEAFNIKQRQEEKLAIIPISMQAFRKRVRVRKHHEL